MSLPQVPPPTLAPPPQGTVAPVPVNPYAAPVTHPTNMSSVDPQAAALVAAVMSGVRFRTIPYVFSIVVMSFRRSMGGVHTVAPGKWPTGELISATFITALFGWWGFPWGAIWSIPALWQLFHGGKDHTKEVLTNAVGPTEAARILSQAQKPKPPASIWLVRAVALVPFILVGLLFFWSEKKKQAEEDSANQIRQYYQLGTPAGHSRFQQR